MTDLKIQKRWGSLDAYFLSAWGDCSFVVEEAEA